MGKSLFCVDKCREDLFSERAFKDNVFRGGVVEKYFNIRQRTSKYGII